MTYPYQGYDELNWFGFYFGNNYRYLRKNKRVSSPEAVAMVSDSAELEEVVVVGYGTKTKEAYTGSATKIESDEKWNTRNSGDNVTKDEEINADNIQIRKNLNETAFFFPQLQTDKEGNVSFNFTAPEALTKWKLQLLAHTKTLESAVTKLETVTQKELMVIPNAPRFLREGDEITISTKIQI